MSSIFTQKPRRYYALLDCARGIAAICVLFAHYHFLYLPVGAENVSASFSPSDQPLFWLFRPVYLYGQVAVQFFWIISGFVFANVYSGAEVSASEFARARFARLYPLHLLTLFVIMLLQLTALTWEGGFLIYQKNDFYHFLLHIGFASGWGLQQGYSFNAPIWSVSVEVLIYIVFWLTSKTHGQLRMFLPALLFASFGCLCIITPRTIWYCGACFFIGVLLRTLLDTEKKPILSLSVGLLLFLAGPILYALRSTLDGTFIALASMPGLVLMLTSLEGFLPHRLKKIGQWVGDCSYGIYLWQIPILILSLLALDRLVGSRVIVSSPWFLLLFLFTAVLAARVSFVLFERPIRERLRKSTLIDGVLRQNGRHVRSNKKLPQPLRR
jgi:peptidoglycan/LPS O-acetylase OafA/YrhL